MSTPFVILAIAFANGWIKVPVRWALTDDHDAVVQSTNQIMDVDCPASYPARVLRVCTFIYRDKSSCLCKNNCMVIWCMLVCNPKLSELPSVYLFAI
jgi:hypothetical protein